MKSKNQDKKRYKLKEKKKRRIITNKNSCSNRVVSVLSVDIKRLYAQDKNDPQDTKKQEPSISYDTKI